MTRAMRDRIGRGWLLTSRSWALVRHERKLLVFPTLQMVFTLVAMVVIFGTAGWLGWELRSWQTFVLLVALAYPLTFVGTFFGVAFVAMGRRALDGEEVSVGAGIRCAVARLRPIAAWSLLAAGVGVVLQALQQIRADWIAASVATWLAGLAWVAVSFFALPVLALENTGAVETVKRSAATFKSRWGEEFTGTTAIATVFLVIAFPFLLVGAIAVGVAAAVSLPLAIAVGTVVIVAFLALVSLWTAMTQLFSLVLYRYATTGDVPPAFPRSDLDQAFKRRRAGLFGRLRGKS